MPPEINNYSFPPQQRRRSIKKIVLLSVAGVIVIAVLVIGGIFAWRTFFAPKDTTVSRPSTPTAGIIGETDIFFAWKKFEGAAGYTLECATNDAFTGKVVSVKTTENMGSCKELTKNTEYSVRVKVDGGTTPSEVLKVKTANPLATPADITFSALSATEVKYSFAAVDSALSYDVQRATDQSFSKDITTLSVVETSGTITELTPKTTYYFHVRALNQGPVQNTTPYSETFSVTTR